MRNVTLRAAFTFLELLVILVLFATLTAMLFPVFAQMRAKTRETTCLSNLRQIGVGMGMYAQDYDGLYPYGASPLDKDTNHLADFDGGGSQAEEVKKMPFLHDTLQPYIKSKDVWRCPADTGFTELSEWPDPTTGAPVQWNTSPSCFETTGSSYTYNTPLAFHHKLFASDGYQGKNEVGPEKIMVLSDLTGKWHNGYVTLLGDGHVKRLGYEAWVDVETVQVDR